ncbi:MAG: hypothetical protein K6G31_09640 [Paludibacteraceae bacterium]|nr:hypothetical protein [Paludibacteraceae bacterium]
MRKIVRFFLFIVALSVSDMTSARDSEPILPKAQMRLPKKNAPAREFGGRDKISGLTESAQNKIISLMAEALDSFATVSLYIADEREIETMNAIDSVHNMKMSALDDSEQFVVRLATLSKMRAYTAYGMSYTVALLASSRLLKAGYDVNELPTFAIQHAIHLADLLSMRIAEPDYFSMKELSSLNFASYGDMSFYFSCFNGAFPKEDDGYLSHDNHVKFIADFASGKVDSLANQTKMQYRVMSILDSPAFLWTYQPFIFRFCSQSSDILLFMDYITASDTFSRLLIDDAFKNVSDEEFEDGLLKITELKSRVLLLIVKRISEQYRK